MADETVDHGRRAGLHEIHPGKPVDERAPHGFGTLGSGHGVHSLRTNRGTRKRTPDAVSMVIHDRCRTRPLFFVLSFVFRCARIGTPAET